MLHALKQRIKKLGWIAWFRLHKPARPAIGLVVSSFDKGGLEQVVLNLYRGYLAAGRQVYLLVEENILGPMARQVPAGHLFVFDRDERKFLAFCREKGINTLHYHYNTFLMKGARLIGFRILYTIHNIYTWKNDAEMAAYAAKLQSAHVLVAVSGFVRDYFCARTGLPGERVEVINNGVQLDELSRPASLPFTRESLGLQEGDVALAMVASFHPVKHQIGMLGVMRRLQTRLPGAKLLHDDCLYEKAPAAAIAKKYTDVIRVMNTPDKEPHSLSGWRGMLADDFGVLLFPREQDRVAEARRADRVRLFALMDDVEGTAYPVRLYPLPEEERQKLVESLNYMRRYSVWSLLAIFLSLSVFGWLWEVGLHLVSTGELVNRGVLHGPWLPIYGTGAVLMLTVLYRLRGRPALEFLATILLCGTLEYMTSLVLELANGGTKWWDYSGYFLNLNGRICAEGLLVFGVGGLAVVYMVAPLLDEALARVGRKKLVAVCTVAAAVFLCDAVWSQFEPNTGRGVTDIEGGRPAPGYVQQAES